MIPREAAAFAAADLVLAIKAEEAAHVAATAPGTAVATLPFAVDIPATDPSGPRPPVALFVGAVNPPNVDALDWLLAEIWPLVRGARPDARLRVVGRVAERAGVPWPEGAEAVGFVDDLAPEYAGAAVVLAPIRFGSGVKIKLVEGLAQGLPGVATPAGAEGLAALPPGVLRVAGPPKASPRRWRTPSAIPTRARRGPRRGRRRRRTTPATPSPGGSRPTSTGPGPGRRAGNRGGPDGMAFAPAWP